MSHPRQQSSTSCLRWAYFALMGSALHACADPLPPALGEPVHIAVLMPLGPDTADDEPHLPLMEWARHKINAAGGVAGRELVLDYLDPELGDIRHLGEHIASDETYVAAIGPAGTPALMEVADFFVANNKPIVSTTSTSDEVLRAYGGKRVVWRTRESDIAQTELLVRYAHQNGARRLTLLTSLEDTGYTFFSWFGFFARELGFAEDDVHIIALRAGQPCIPQVQEALASAPEFIFVAAGSPTQMMCVAQGLPPDGAPRPRVVFADTGLDPYVLEQVTTDTDGVEGFTGGGDEQFHARFRDHFGDYRPAPHGASEHDAVLLLAYGLQLSGGRSGPTLMDALADISDGGDPDSHDWDAEGVANALAALAEGARPLLRGATGELRFEPELYMDLAASTYTHWRMRDGRIALDERYSTGDTTFLTSAGPFVSPNVAPPDLDVSQWTPAQPRSDSWAIIAALSSGWSNYRHQADALRQYWMLRARGMDDDHIVLIMADDLADSTSNQEPGQVRNQPGGADLYQDAVIDYDLSLSEQDLVAIITGQRSAATPTVIAPSASSNIYIYLVGHGGTAGIPLGATATDEGLAGGDDTFSPTHLRQALCTLHSDDRYRRVMAVIESCYAGAFGDAHFGGIESGCDTEGDPEPLAGVLLMTAANSREVSYAGAYDQSVPAWVNDAFSDQLATRIEITPDSNLADLYTDVYGRMTGSHPSLYNLAAAGRLTTTSIAEFHTP